MSFTRPFPSSMTFSTFTSKCSQPCVCRCVKPMATSESNARAWTSGNPSRPSSSNWSSLRNKSPPVSNSVTTNTWSSVSKASTERCKNGEGSVAERMLTSRSRRRRSQGREYFSLGTHFMAKRPNSPVGEEIEAAWFSTSTTTPYPPFPRPETTTRCSGRKGRLAAVVLAAARENSTCEGIVMEAQAAASGVDAGEFAEAAEEIRRLSKEASISASAVG
mmetsp:Transcript_37181/g.75433  ORF Transcript_37181/g.75433 Transcript_37181/m.75433 type:complete len:219 (+) Transcript_37181:545-1201(+)